MVAIDPPFDPYEAADAPLREKEARLIAELDAVRKSRSAIAAARSAAGPLHHIAPLNLSSSTMGSTPINAPEKFKGIGLEEAVARQLAENKGIELTAKQVWAGLSAAGFSILSERPEAAVNWALRKRERKKGDVILVGDGKWGLTEWYSPGQIKRFKDARNNASGRNHVEHVERTKAGIANAKRTRLQQWGRRRSITGEQMAKAYEAIQNGARSKLQAAKAADMAWPTFNLYWRQYEMENWKPGDPFPPARRAVEKKASDFTLENMWPRKELFPAAHMNGNENGPRH